MNWTKIFTTANSAGVVLRYLGTILGSLLAIAGILGVLTPEEIASITAKVRDISAQLPELLTAIGALMAIVIPTYAAVTKASSDKAAEVAKEVDKLVPPEQTVVIKTPVGIPDVIVPPK